MPIRTPEPKRLNPGRAPIKATAREQRRAGNKGAGRPSKLDGRDFWLILDRLTSVLGSGGTDALAARTIGVHPNTLAEWRKAAEAKYNELSDDDQESLRSTVITYVGGDKGPLVSFPCDRLAKLACVIEQGEANWVIAQLANANRDSRRAGQGRLALGMLTRKYGASVYPPSHVPIESNPNDKPADGAGGLQIKRVTIAIPANGFRPGEPVDGAPDDDDDDGSDDVPVTDRRKRRPSKKSKRRKAG